jgi:hypothetical protein
MWHSTLCLLSAVQVIAGSSFFLPTEIKPSHYDLRVTYDIDPATNFSYFGVVDILVSNFLSLSIHCFNVQMTKE